MCVCVRVCVVSAGCVHVFGRGRPRACAYCVCAWLCAHVPCIDQLHLNVSSFVRGNGNCELGTVFLLAPQRAPRPSQWSLGSRECQSFSRPRGLRRRTRSGVRLLSREWADDIVCVSKISEVETKCRIGTRHHVQARSRTCMTSIMIARQGRTMIEYNGIE